jgi:hypothetical protein
VQLPRMTTRRWMAWVVVAALGLSLILTFQRFAEYRRMFKAYDHDLRFIRQTIRLNEQRVEALRGRGSRDPQAAAEAAALSEGITKLRQSALELDRRRAKYESAVWRPWSLLDTNPPPARP